jgi:hypothetical protein
MDVANSDVTLLLGRADECSSERLAQRPLLALSGHDWRQRMSAFGGKADIAWTSRRLVALGEYDAAGKKGHVASLLLAQ